MDLTGLYSINDIDIFTAYGLVVRSGTDDFLKYPDRKPPVINKDWPDENGSDVDISESPVFQEKSISLQVAIIANSTDEFWLKYQALFDVLSQPETLRFYVAEFDRSFFIYYDSITAFTRLTRTKVNGFIGEKVVCTYTIKFIEPIPSFLTQFSFLMDIDSNFIVTEDNLKIIVNT